ncbi:MAG: thiazole synthase [Venatoribacter sp.]
MNVLKINNELIKSRLWLGSGLYQNPAQMHQVLSAGEPGFITLSLKKQSLSELQQQKEQGSIWQYLQQQAEQGAKLLPNTAACFTAKEAILQAQLSREIFKTDWIKLEVIGDTRNLQPHNQATIEAAQELVAQGFNVLPYCTDDLIVCEALLKAGCHAVMPWAAPIGTGLGLLNPYQLSQLRHYLPEAVLVVDAGIGKPSQALAAMEMGFDAVLLNTACARAQNPVLMAQAFKQAVAAGRLSYLAGTMNSQSQASPSTLKSA